MKKTALSLAALLVGITLLQITAGAQSKEVGIVAHRGFWNCEEAGYAENSIAALRCAQEAGFRGSEFDVRMTSDSVLIVYHDTRINGRKIEKLSYSEISDITLENGEPLPTLDMYLEQGKKHPETMLVIEFKPNKSKESDTTLVNLTIETLKSQGMYDPERVMFISFGPHICEMIAAEHPQFTVMYLGFLKGPGKISRLGVDGIGYHHMMLSFCSRLTVHAKRLGMDVNAWTLTKAAATRRTLSRGVDLITTDTPLLARELIKEVEIREKR